MKDKIDKKITSKEIIKKTPEEKRRAKREKDDNRITASDVGETLLKDIDAKLFDTEEPHVGMVRSTISPRKRIDYKDDIRKLNRNVRKQRVQEKFSRIKDSFGIVWKVFKYAKEYQYLLWLTIAFDLFGIFLELAIPAVLGYAIDCVVGVGQVDFSRLLNYVVLLCGMIAVSGLEKWAEAVFTNLYCIKATKKIRQLLFEKFDRVPLSVIDSHQHGDLLDRMTNDIEEVTSGFLDSIQSVFSGVITIVGTIVFMLVLNVQMAAVIILVTPLSLLFTVFIAKRSRKLFNRMAKAQGAISGHMEEYFSGQRIVKAFGYENDSIEKYEEINQEFYVVSEKASFLSKLIGPITRFINGLVYGLVGLFGSLLALRGLMSVGMISAFLTYANDFGKPFSEISDEVSSIQEAFASARRVFEMLDKKDEPSDSMLLSLANADGSLELKDVCFSYAPKQKLIENLNLKVKPGQKIAIVGPTGCGKSTLINLLMRFYDVNSGEIIFSGNDVRTITRASLREKYGMVLQETWLFSGTVFQNIAYGKPAATQEEVEEAAKMAGVHDFIMKMPKGYQTKVEDGGSNISQGQQQLLCIARIMLLRPPMLILDEATSNIDTNTELKIQAAFNKIMEGRTSFIIAHRLSTITNADMILVMNKGNVVEKGNHVQLMKKKGFYYHLYESQFS